MQLKRTFQLAPSQTLWELRLSGVVKIVLGHKLLPVYKTSNSWQNIFSCHVLFFPWVTDLSLISTLLSFCGSFSNLYFFPPFILGGGNRVCEEVGRVSVKFLFLRHHAFCPFPLLSIWHTKYHRATMKFIKMCFFFLHMMAFLHFSSCFAFPYLKIINTGWALKIQYP